VFLEKIQVKTTLKSLETQYFGRFFNWEGFRGAGFPKSSLRNKVHNYNKVICIPPY
jgi:hypothetical protein